MLVKPSDLKVNKVSENDTHGVYELGPLPTGFGHTLGNVLRRVLLTSVKGAAITQMKITGVDHQFTTITGVKEDVVEISLNLKQVRFKAHSDSPMITNIEKKGPGEVTAKDIKTSSDLEIVNKDLHIATLSDKNTVFKAELIVETGDGYSPSEDRQSSKIGVILLDALFSSVLSVSYEVLPTRSGNISGLDKLVLNIQTDGSVTPREAVLSSVNSLRDFFRRLAEWDVLVSPEMLKEDSSSETSSSKSAGRDVLVDELPLPTRTINALKKQNINTLGALAEKTDDQISDIKNLGEKSIEEIKKLMVQEGYR